SIKRCRLLIFLFLLYPALRSIIVAIQDQDTRLPFLSSDIKSNESLDLVFCISALLHSLNKIIVCFCISFFFLRFKADNWKEVINRREHFLFDYFAHLFITFP